MKQENKFVGNELKYLNNVLRSKSSYVLKLENLFSIKNKVKYSIAVNSGTAALHACLAALGVGYGDEVIVSPLTWVSSINTIVLSGATPIFADVDLKTGLIDPESIRDKISKKTIPLQYIDQKRIVDINKLLNRVKTDQKNETKQKIIFYSLTTLVLGLFSTLIMIVK